MSIVQRGFEGAIFLLRLLNRIFTDLILLLLDLSILFLSDLYFSFSFPLLTKGIWEGGSGMGCCFWNQSALIFMSIKPSICTDSGTLFQSAAALFTLIDFKAVMKRIFLN